MDNSNNYLRKYIKKITSQNGEEGVVEHILEKIYGSSENINNLEICEIGSGDGFFLSNSYHFIKKFNAKALMVEARELDLVLSRKIYKNYNVIHEETYVNSINTIDKLLSKHEFKKDLDILSIDIDGQDYHVFNRLEVYRPKIIIIECNMTMQNDVIIFEEEGDTKGIGASARAIYELAKTKNYILCLQLFNNLVLIDRSYFDKLEFPNSFNPEEEIHNAFTIQTFQDHNGNIHNITQGPWESKNSKIINYNKAYGFDDSGGVHQVSRLINLEEKGNLVNKNIKKNKFVFKKIYKDFHINELNNFMNYTLDAQKGYNTSNTEPGLLNHNQNSCLEFYASILRKDKIIRWGINTYQIKADLSLKTNIFNNSEKILRNKNYLINTNERLKNSYFKINNLPCMNDEAYSKLLVFKFNKEKIYNHIEVSIIDSTKNKVVSTANTSQIPKHQSNLIMFFEFDYGLNNVMFKYLSYLKNKELDPEVLEDIHFVSLLKNPPE